MTSTVSHRLGLRAGAAALLCLAGCVSVIARSGGNGSGTGPGEAQFQIDLTEFDESGAFLLLPDAVLTRQSPIVLFTTLEEGPSEPPSSATLTLSAEDMIIRPVDGNDPVSGNAEVLFRFAAADDADVCASPVLVGPFEVAVDEGALTVAEETLGLTANGVALVATGRFSLCVEVRADFSAEMEIFRVTLVFGQGIAPPDGNDGQDEPGNLPPVAVIRADPTDGPAPLSVVFDATESEDPDGTIEAYAWEFGDGQTADGPTAEYEFLEPGSYEVTLSVEDDDGAVGAASVTIAVAESPLRTVIHRGTVDEPFTPVPDDDGADGSLIGVAVSGDGQVVYLATAGDEEQAPRIWRSDRDGTNVAELELPGVEFAGANDVTLAVDQDGSTVFLRAGVDGAIYRVDGAAPVQIYDPVTNTDVPVEQVGSLRASAEGDSLVFQDADQPFELYRLDAGGGSPTLIFDPTSLPEANSPDGIYRGLLLTGYAAAADGTVVATVVRRRDDNEAEADWVDLYRIAGGEATQLTTTHDVARDASPSIADTGTIVYLRDVMDSGGELRRTGYVLDAGGTEGAARLITPLPMYLAAIAGDGSRLLVGFESAVDVRRTAIVAGDLGSSLTMPVELSAAGISASQSLETVLDWAVDGNMSLKAVSPGRVGPAGYPQVTAVAVAIDAEAGAFTISATVADADGQDNLGDVSAWITGPGDEYIDLIESDLNPFRSDEGVEAVGRTNALIPDATDASLYTLTADLPHPERLTDEFRLRIIARDQGGRGSYADVRFVPIADETLDTNGDGVGD